MFHVKQFCFIKNIVVEKLLIITGATSGIGLACIKEFITIPDINILAIGRDFTKFNLDDARIYPRGCDVTDFIKLQLLLNDYFANYLVVGLVNAAGVVGIGELDLSTHQSNQDMLNVNIAGLTNCIEIVLPQMRKQQLGTIINLSSLADRYPRPNNAVYAATKAYVKSLSDSLRMQNAPYNIRVVNVAPALVETPMEVDGLGIKDGLIKVADFAKIIKFIFEQPQELCIRDIVVAPTNYIG